MAEFNKAQEKSAVLRLLDKHDVEYNDNFSDTLTVKPLLYIDLFLYYGDTMPYKYQKARDADPYLWIEDRLQELLS